MYFIISSVTAKIPHVTKHQIYGVGVTCGTLVWIRILFIMVSPTKLFFHIFKHHNAPLIRPLPSKYKTNTIQVNTNWQQELHTVTNTPRCLVFLFVNNVPGNLSANKCFVYSRVKTPIHWQINQSLPTFLKWAQVFSLSNIVFFGIPQDILRSGHFQYRSQIVSCIPPVFPTWW